MPDLLPLSYEPIRVGSYHDPINLTLKRLGVLETLTGASVAFRMVREADGLEKVNWQPGSVPSTGILRYDFAPTDVDTAGLYLCYWRVTYSDTKPWISPEILLEIQPVR